MDYDGILLTPKDIAKNSYNPHGVQNAIFGMPCSRTSIFQYPDFKSIFANILAPQNGQASLQVTTKDTN